MSDANQMKFSYKREVTEDTAPAGPYQELALTGGTFGLQVNTVRSNRKRTDGQRANTIRLGTDPQAAPTFEFYAGDLDDLLIDAIRSDDNGTWPTEANFSASATFADADPDTIAGTGIDTNVNAGDWVFITGAANAANNGWHKVRASATDLLTVESALVGETVSINLKGSTIQNGSIEPSFTIELDNNDLTNKVRRITGCKVSGFNLSIPLGGIMTGGFEFAGRTFSFPGTATGISPSNSENSMAEVNDFEGFYLDYQPVTDDILSVTLNIATPTRFRQGLGSGGVKSGVSLGALEATGQISFYQEDNTWQRLLDFDADTARPMAWAIQNNSKRYIFEFNSAKLTDEAGDIGAPDTDTEFQFGISGNTGPNYTGDTSGDKTVTIARVA